jgi:NAD(P)-dependent dehydrogenase (short-subunit alcohol dehydrogenase family)
MPSSKYVEGRSTKSPYSRAKALTAVLGPYDIRVNCVLPGAILTDTSWELLARIYDARVL